MGIASDMLRLREQQEQGSGQTVSERVLGRSSAKEPIYRSPYDVTFGAAEYGAAETAGLLAEGVNRFTGNRLDPLTQFALSMDQFKKDHKEYSPVEVNSAAELLQNPAALSSRVFSGAAQTAMGLGAIAVPYVGVPLSAGLTYTIEGQRAYNDALGYTFDDGTHPTHDQASAAAMRIGAAAAALDTFTNLRILSFAKGNKGWFATKIATRAEKIMRAGGLTADAAGMAVSAATYGVIQGAVNEGLANATYGRKVEEGFWDRRIQDAIGAAASAVVYGLPAKGIHQLLSKPGTNEQHQVQLDVVDRDTFREHLINDKGMEPKWAQYQAEIVDSFARNWASRMNEPVEKWYGTYVQPESVVGERVSDHIADDAQHIPKIFFQKDPVKSIQDFFTTIANDITPGDKEIFARYGVETPQKMTEVMTRYLQEGIAPAPELVEPFEAYKQLMKDVWNTTKEAAQRVMYGRTISGGPGTAFAAKKTGDKIEIARFHKNLDQPKGDIWLSNEPIEIPKVGEIREVDPSTGRYFTQEELARVVEARDEGPIPSQLRSALDRVFSLDTDEIAEARTRLYKSEEELLKFKELETVEPQGPRFYHGGEQKISKIDPTKFGSRTDPGFFGEGFYVTEDSANAKRWGPEVTEGTLNLKNPLLVTGMSDFIKKSGMKSTNDPNLTQQQNRERYAAEMKRVTDELKAKGYDGVIYTRSTGVKQATVFYPEGFNLSSQDQRLTSPQDIPVVDLEKGISVKHIPGTIEQQDMVVKAMYDDLRRLQMSRLMPDRDSAVARRAEFSGTIREVMRHLTPDERVSLSKWQETIDWFHSGLDYAAPLAKRFKSGKVLMDALADVISIRNKFKGEWSDPNWDAFHALAGRDKRWLKKTTDTYVDAAKKNGYYFDNFHRFIDAVGTPDPIVDAPTKVLGLFREHIRKINVTFGTIFEREGGLQHIQGEEPVPYRQPKELRMLRFATDELRSAVRSREGPIYAALKEAVQALDPKAKLGSVDSALAEFAKDTGIKESGPLTDSRTIRYMPTGVIVNGKKIQLFHTEPHGYLDRSVRTQAYQIGWNRVIGDRDLDRAHTSSMKKFLENTGIEAPYNINTLKQRFKEKGIDIPETTELKDLEKLAKSLKIEVGPKRRDYVNAIERLTIDDMTSPDREKFLRNFAKDMGGIDPNLPTVRLLDEVKRRAKEGSINVIDKLKEAIRDEGGSVEMAARVIRLSQGIPIYLTTGDRDFERTMIGRGLNVASGLIGTAQTSMATVANIPQTIVQVPHMVGLKNFISAVDFVLKNPAEAKRASMVLGAIGDTHTAWGLERGYKLEGMTRNFRQAVQKFTGMKLIGDLNNIIAGESFRRLALEWQADPKKVTAKDVEMLRGLEMSPEQIKQIQSGEMSDHTFAKIVQQGVAKTQYVTESAHRRGWLENHPIARMLFAYNSYASGTARSTIEFGRETVAAFKSGNTDHIARQMGRALVLLGGALGAGAMSEAARNIVRGDVSRDQRDDDETILHRGAAALMAVQFIGPAQRMLDSYRYDAGSKDAWITGLMPQLRAVGDMLALGANIIDKARGEEPKYGKFAKFDAFTQIAEGFKNHTPVAKAYKRWQENIAYPNTVAYNEVKAAAGKFAGEHSDRSGGYSQEQLNPEYYNVWQWVVRGDEQMAMKAAQQYYDDYYTKFKLDPEEGVMRGMSQDHARLGLRQSLRSRAPLNMNPRLMAEFISKLPEDKQEKYIETHAKYMRLVNAVAPSND